MSQTIRYSDVDLAEFKAHIDKKIEKGREYLLLISEQIYDLNENKGSEGDWMDDTSSNSDLELLFTMQARQQKHLQDLENALLRIRNKSYGICIVTRKLIDKRRLMAVPSTSRSMVAKMAEPTLPHEERAAAPKRTRPNRVISKVIKNKEPVVKSKTDDFEGENYSYEMEERVIDVYPDKEFDFDNIAAED